MRLLVVGAGSIGLRHLRNLRHLGVGEVLACDPDPARVALAQGEGARPCASLVEGLETRPDGVLICAPPARHLEIARMALESGAHLFIEKPLAAGLGGVEDVLKDADRMGRVVAVGYNLRFHAGLRRVKALVDDGAVGRLLMLRAEFGQYLPDWRPGQDYRRGYIGQAEGGGIILDASHELDYVRWIGGEVEGVAAMAGTLGDLDMAAEDTALILLRMRGGVIAHVHLDCLQRAYSRGCKIVGTEGTLTWDFTTGVRLFRGGRGRWDEEFVAPDVNDMYVDEMRQWLACLQEGETPVVSGHDGWRVLQIALAAREAATTGREIAV